MVAEGQDRQAEDQEADDDARRSGGSTRTRRWSRRARAGTGRGSSGQSGQPSPNSVARTMTPIMTSRSSDGRRAVAWKRQGPRWNRGIDADGHSTRRRRQTDPTARSAARLSRRMPHPDVPVVLACRVARPARRGLRFAAASSPAASASRVRRLGDRLRDRARRLDGAGWRLRRPRAEPRVMPVLIAQTRRAVCGRIALLFASLDASNQSGRGAGPVALTVALLRPGQRPARPIATADGTFLWAIEGDARHLRRRRRRSRSRRHRARSSPRRRRRHDRDDPGTVPGPARPRRRSRSARRRPPSKTPTLPTSAATRRRSRPNQARPGLLQDVGRPGARAAQAVRARLRDPEVLPERAVRPDARQASSPSRPSTRTVTFINVEPYQLKTSTASSSRSSTPNSQLQATTSTDDGGCSSEPWIFVVDGNGVVRGSFERSPRQPRSSRRSPPIEAGS